MNILENEETVPAEKDEAKDNYKINLMSGDGAAGGSGEIYTDTSTTPVICNGNLFSVVSILPGARKATQTEFKEPPSQCSSTTAEPIQARSFSNTSNGATQCHTIGTTLPGARP
jgi:hypothetical protein